MKKADADNCASASLSVKMPFTAATSGSISDVMKPQAKKSTVTAANAATAFDRPPMLADAWLGSSMQISSSPKLCYTVGLTRRRSQCNRLHGDMSGGGPPVPGV